MIRDLRSGRVNAALPRSESLAFAREQVLGVGRTGNRANAETSIGAFTIAVTAPRLATCKRGLAAHLAAHLAATKATSGLRVCVLDTDLESRDIGMRFGIGEPTLLDIANDLSLRDDAARLPEAIARLRAPELSVVPVQVPLPPLLPMLYNRAVSLLDQLRAAFDFVVVDVPIGFGSNGEAWEEAMLERIDALLVAVSAEPSAFGGALRYLNTLGSLRTRRAIPGTFDTHLVLTGSEDDGSRSLATERALDRKLRGVPVLASIPQLWGRRMPRVGDTVDMPLRLHEEFAAIVSALTGVGSRSAD